MNTAAPELAPPKSAVPATNRAEPDTRARPWGTILDAAHGGQAVRYQVPRATPAPTLAWSAQPAHHAEPLSWAMTATIALYGAVLAMIGVLIYTSV